MARFDMRATVPQTSDFQIKQSRRRQHLNVKPWYLHNGEAETGVESRVASGKAC